MPVSLLLWLALSAQRINQIEVHDGTHNSPQSITDTGGRGTCPTQTQEANPDTRKASKPEIYIMTLREA